jgi:hypothetical protein
MPGNGGRVVIINLQQTELDKSADLNIRAKCDLVFEMLMPLLHTKIPVYGQHNPMKFVLPPKWESESSSEESSSEEEPRKNKTATAKKKGANAAKPKASQKPKKRETKNSAGRSILPKTKLSL